jgi:hypothetical protein
MMMVKDSGRVTGSTSLRSPEPLRVSAHSGYDPARGDYLRCPAPPLLGGGVKPTEWLEHMAEADDKKKAHVRAREARAIADWLRRISRWLVAECYEVPPAIAMEAAKPSRRETGSTRKGDSAGRNGIAQESIPSSDMGKGE